MRDFDEQRRVRESRDRRFVIAGETFSYRAGVAPEVLGAWMDLGSGVDGPVAFAEQIKLADDTVVAFLEPGQAEKWTAVRSKDAPHPLTQDDLRDLIEWLVEQSSLRPTEQPSPSTTGSETEKSGTPLTDDSEFPVAAV